MASKRNYLSQAELAEYADITITNTTEADDQISQSEELIDAYVGFQQKAVHSEVIGRVASATTTTITLEATRHQNVWQANYFTYCEVEITAGTGAGQRRQVASSTYAGVVTVTSAFTTTPDSTSYYRIYQLGKFPRYSDVYFDGEASVQTYVKTIPEPIRRAVAAQVEYYINMGANHFKTNSSAMESEDIGNYSYTRGSTQDGDGDTLIAPKAMRLLRGYVNRKGVMIAGD